MTRKRCFGVTSAAVSTRMCFKRERTELLKRIARSVILEHVPSVQLQLMNQAVGKPCECIASVAFGADVQ